MRSHTSRAPFSGARASRVVAGFAMASLLVVACSSETIDDNRNDGPPDNTGSMEDGDSNPDNQDTVVPPVSVGVGGGAPVDNLDSEVEPATDDVDGDGSPD